jgi:hydrogenase maturation protease
LQGVNISGATMNLIVGVGNLLRCDEGIGIHIIRELERSDIFADTVFADMGTSSYDILSCITGQTKKMVLVDCVKAENYEPGTVFNLTIDDLKKRQLSNFSLHQFELVDSLKLISLDMDLPQTMVIGIVPADINTFSMELSPALKLKYSGIILKVEEEIRRFFKKDA